MAIYYVKSTGGSDSNDGLSVANAWATIGHATINAYVSTQETEIRILKDGTHFPTGTITLPHASTGSKTQLLVGADTSGNRLTDGSHVIISGASITTPAGKPIIETTNATGTAYLHFRNLRFTACAAEALAFTKQAVINAAHCRFDNSQNGVKINAQDNGCASGYLYGVNCEFDNNTVSGIAYNACNRGIWQLYGCRIHNNGSHGIYNRTDVKIIHCLIYNNGGGGVSTGSSANTISVMTNNTIYNNAGDGVKEYANDSLHIHSGNIFASNGGYGYTTTNQGNTGNQQQMHFNLFHNNTSGTTPFGSLDFIGQNNISGDPLFESTTEGDANFLRLSTSSPAVDAGPFPGMDIGALKSMGGGGSGGGTVGYAL